MSTELKTIKCLRGPNLGLTSYCGGETNGVCLQITKDNGDEHAYFQLNKTQARELVFEINKWLVGDYSSSEDFIVGGHKNLREFTD